MAAIVVLKNIKYDNFVSYQAIKIYKWYIKFYYFWHDKFNNYIEELRIIRDKVIPSTDRVILGSSAWSLRVSNNISNYFTPSRQ